MGAQPREHSTGDSNSLTNSRGVLGVLGAEEISEPSPPNAMGDANGS